MAKAKATRKSSIRTKLPAGYKAIEGGGNAWKTEKKGESIEGKLIKVKVIKMPARGKKGSSSYQMARDVNLYTIETANGVVNVFQSAGLKALESVKKGKSVFIQYIGKRVITKGQNPMREYIVATK
jgi:hypothetical protein